MVGVQRLSTNDLTGSSCTRSTAGSRPKVTVCVITYNQEEYIRDCLQGLIEQKTDFPFEVIVGDDFSTDGTRAVIQEFAAAYPHLVRPLFQSTNSGGSRNYLEVHAAARGEYVAHVDGDDCALPGKLQMQADALDRDLSCNAVWHRVDLFDDSGAFASGHTADLSSFRNGCVAFADAARLGYVGAHSSLMYRRSARQEVVDFDQVRLDIYATFELLSTGHGLILNQVLGRYRVASSGSISAAKFVPTRRLAIQHVGEFLHRFPEARRDFGLWAMSNAVIDAKFFKVSAWDFVKLAGECRNFRIWQVPGNIRRMKNTQVRWHDRQQGKRDN